MPRGCPIASPEERFLKRTVIDGECRLWTGGKFINGYGQLTGKTYGSRYAHQWACHHWNGSPLPVEKDMEVSHTCDVKHCVNPAHLKYQTKSENMNDMYIRNPTAFGRKAPTETEIQILKECIANGETRRETARKVGHDRDWMDRIIRDYI